MSQEKTNIAELLKNCPKGMELSCTMYENVYFDKVDEEEDHLYPIICYIVGDGIKNPIHFTKFGEFSSHINAKCVIFPKGKTTWEGFQGPFEPGDIVINNYNEYAFIYSGENDNYWEAYCGVYCGTRNICINSKQWSSKQQKIRLATEKEKAKLLQTIKDNGYNWNAETKTLEKLIETQFKVGDRIKRKGDTRLTTIKDIRDNCYIITFPDLLGHAHITDKLLFSNQHEYELVPKFDITTLQPFDRVLVRGNVGQKWTHDFFGFMDKNRGYPFVCVGHYVSQCIPYEGNEHLLGKTDDCEEHYKNWK